MWISSVMGSDTSANAVARTSISSVLKSIYPVCTGSLYWLPDGTPWTHGVAFGLTATSTTVIVDASTTMSQRMVASSSATEASSPKLLPSSPATSTTIPVPSSAQSSVHAPPVVVLPSSAGSASAHELPSVSIVAQETGQPRLTTSPSWNTRNAGPSIAVHTSELSVLVPVISVLGSTVAPNPAPEHVFNSRTAAPAITIPDHTISMTPSASVVIIDGSSSQLSVPMALESLPAVIVDGSTIVANSNGNYIIASQTLVPGGPAVILSGIPISIAPSATAPVVGDNTQRLSSAIVAAASPAIIAVAGITVTANSAGQYIVASQTLVPGATPLTVSGTILSLAPSATALVIGSSTHVISMPTPMNSANMPTLVIASSSITANTAGEYIVASQILSPGGQPITVSGTPISLAPAASALVVGSSTQVLKSAPTTGTETGSYISGVGGSQAATKATTGGYSGPLTTGAAVTLMPSVLYALASLTTAALMIWI